MKPLQPQKLKRFLFGAISIHSSFGIGSGYSLQVLVALRSTVGFSLLSRIHSAIHRYSTFIDANEMGIFKLASLMMNEFK